MQTEFCDLNGQRFFLRRWGDPAKPPLLMLHGFPEYSGAWNDVAPLLAKDFHCIAPDQRGYGRSWAPDEVDAYKGGALVSDMTALIEQIGGPVTVFGHDWGAAVAYGLAMFHPDLVSHLIIANGVHPVPFQRAMAAGGAQSEASAYIAFLRRANSHEELAANDFERMMNLFTARMGSSWLDPERAQEYKTEWARDGRLRTMIHWYRASPLVLAEPGKPITILPEFPKEKLQVFCPHLLIWGAEDTALLPESTEGLEEFAPRLTRVTLPEADHWLLHQEPKKVVAAVKTWLAAL